MKAAKQTTLRDSATLTGVGVHSGLPVTLTIHPAEIDCGITFLRSGIDGCPDRDNDNDGVPDAEDRCPNTPGPPENAGCPIFEQ